MTDYRTIPAGPELDALIAEKVMGLRVEWISGKPWWVGGNELPGSPAILCPGKFGHSIEPYSKHISFAWEVVEKLKEDFGGISVGDRNTGHIGCWNVSFHDEFGIQRHSGWCKTAPLAICRAALKIIKKESGS